MCVRSVAEYQAKPTSFVAVHSPLLLQTHPELDSPSMGWKLRSANHCLIVGTVCTVELPTLNKTHTQHERLPKMESCLIIAISRHSKKQKKRRERKVHGSLGEKSREQHKQAPGSVKKLLNNEVRVARFRKQIKAKNFTKRDAQQAAISSFLFISPRNETKRKRQIFAT